MNSDDMLPDFSEAEDHGGDNRNPLSLSRPVTPAAGPSAAPVLEGALPSLSDLLLTRALAKSLRPRILSVSDTSHEAILPSPVVLARVHVLERSKPTREDVPPARFRRVHPILAVPVESSKTPVHLVPVAKQNPVASSTTSAPVPKTSPSSVVLKRRPNTLADVNSGGDVGSKRLKLNPSPRRCIVGGHCPPAPAAAASDAKQKKNSKKENNSEARYVGEKGASSAPSAPEVKKKGTFGAYIAALQEQKRAAGK